MIKHFNKIRSDPLLLILNIIQALIKALKTQPTEPKKDSDK